MFANVWIDGSLVSENEALIPVTTHGLHYGTAVFDGGRFYLQPDGQLGIFRGQDHLERFLHGCRTAFLDVPYSFDALWTATRAVVGTAAGPGYVRQMAFPGHGKMGVNSQNRVRTVVLAWHLEPRASKRLKVRLSAIRGSILAGTKLAGQYAQVFIAHREATSLGCDDTLYVDARGCLSEAIAASIFMVARGRLVTPPLYEPMLPGITRDSVLQLARYLGIHVVESPIRLDEIFRADEVFLASSASELRAVGEIEGRPLPETTPVTDQFIAAYRKAVEGQLPAFQNWVTEVPRGVTK